MADRKRIHVSKAIKGSQEYIEKEFDQDTVDFMMDVYARINNLPREEKIRLHGETIALCRDIAQTIGVTAIETKGRTCLLLGVLDYDDDEEESELEPLMPADSIEA